MTIINRIFTILITGTLFINCQAQNVLINGRVTSAETGEILIGANIFVINQALGTSTNEFGYYSIKSKKGKIDLKITFVGYLPLDKNLVITNDTIVNFQLAKQASLSEVVIIGRKNGHDLPTNMFTLSPKSYIHLPSLAGESDIIKTLQLMPGIQSGNEGTTGLIVRGGSPDQNLYLMDGVPLYNISHLYGFLSVFNEDALNNVDVYKGGFPARYGGRLSSVIDVRTKEGNPQKHEINLNLGLISSGFSASGPLIKDRTTYLISFRRSFLDLISRPVAFFNRIQGRDYSANSYSMGDINVKLSSKLSDKDRLFLSFYLSNDQYGQNAESTLRTDSLTRSNSYGESLKWGNSLVNLTWNHVFCNKIFMNTTISRTSYRLTNNYSSNYRIFSNADSIFSNLKASYISDILDYSARINFNYNLSAYHHFNFGTVLTGYRFQPGISIITGSVDSLLQNTSTRFDDMWSGSLDAYFEDRIELPNGLYSRVGLRLSNYFTENKVFTSLEPRLTLGYNLPSGYNVQASYSKMQQPMHLLSNSGLGMPTDLWVPSTANIPPQKSHQFSIGASKTFKAYTFGVEFYYKRFTNLISYAEGASFLMDGKNWQSQIVGDGIGRASGAELLVKKDEGKLKGWLSYTLSWNQRKFNDLNNGEWFDYHYDRRHDFSINLQYYVKNNFVISGTWVFSTGLPVTLPDAVYPYINYPLSSNQWNQTMFRDQNFLSQWSDMARSRGELLYYNSFNNYRLPNYHRLDINMSFIKKLKRCERTISFGVYNAYAHRNAFYVTYVDDTSGAWNMKNTGGFKIVTLLPIIPSFSYRLKF